MFNTTTTQLDAIDLAAEREGSAIYHRRSAAGNQPKARCFTGRNRGVHRLCYTTEQRRCRSVVSIGR